MDRNRKAVVARYRTWFGPFILGGALGAAFMYLLTARPAQAAEASDKLDYIADLLEQLNATALSILERISGVMPGEGDGGVELTLQTPWSAKEPEQIFQGAPRTVQALQSGKMVDMRNVKRLSIRAESSLDQAVTLQLVGNFTNSFTLATAIGPPAVCPANGNIGFGLAWGDWNPYVGVIITPAIAPLTGALTIWAVVQE